MRKTPPKNVYIRSVSETKCSCGKKGLTVWSAGEYGPSWRTVRHFCQDCFADLRRDIQAFSARNDNRKVILRGYQGTRIPAWMREY